MLFASAKTLRNAGIIGMNERNFGLIAHHNPRHLYPMVDNKLKTKILAQQAGITVPKLLGTLQYQHDVKQLKQLLDEHNQFVIKPVTGSGGKGILAIIKQDAGLYIKSSGDAIKLPDITRHVSNILSGLHSLGGKPDTVMIESLIQLDPIFADYSYKGIPDIRIIVFKGYPIMTMLRLTTKASDGKANLHQGGVGVGIDIATGRALHAIQFGQPILHHPDTHKIFSELVIPHWDELLRLAAACYEMTGLGYLGADLVLDKQLGPMIIELNARPGLSIQVANCAGLASRIEFIEKLETITIDPESRVALSQQAFCESQSSAVPTKAIN